MLVQDRQNPKPHQIPLANTFPESNPFDFSNWVSLNLFKIATIFFLTLTIASFFFLQGARDSAAFLCFNSRPKPPDLFHLPKINFDSVHPIVDKSSSYASFSSDRWIVVSVSSYPSDSLRKLAKTRGWQVLAVGNSRTPSDWSLKGVIFLSLEQQSSLGFRVVDFLPYDSYARKTVGYLFAIQHGAKMIFDADDRGEVIDGDLGKHFDLKLSNVDTLQERILQFDFENPNKTVVNPYIHFGQRSVWPRGLPLENVGDVVYEEHYSQVFGGLQFIQQGISNGLPDVDSVFYFTRKTRSEALNIRFDEHAPKVALPHGVMVPLNSFNTLFHTSALWALMLPASVSTMASDILRGYWAQRLLWEVGGFVVVYPPTMFRHDDIEGYPFSEEKDLHVNVGRLVKFLTSWRSNKATFFEKALELSHSMAEEGFWKDNDVKLSVAWLQDLVSVGYIQPRLKGFEMNKQRRGRRSNVGVGVDNRRSFVPQKLPGFHLGVEESETVNFEIGKLVRWRKKFGNVVMILFVENGGVVDRTAMKWRLLYGRIFKTVVVVAEHGRADLGVEEASLEFIYKYLPTVFERFANAEGFLFLQDNTILNYWNLLQADKDKLWITSKVPQSWSRVSDDSVWFAKQASWVKKVVSTMPVDFQVNYKESNPTGRDLVICNCEVFYVPRQFVGDFKDLVALVGNYKIDYRVAVPMFFMAMDLPLNFDDVFGRMVYKKTPGEQLISNDTNLYAAEVPAVHPWRVSNEVEFAELMRLMAAGDPLLKELV
ncbi:probable glycosyltransferase STELLO2 isoform X1 [Cucurbita pepo subsp. pepo]|uniref:probable glycosyltransferase STELLO2 isoform X1 n=1 Tax=Cucurbita pepo subsp. pepo TaxID=3664 RepID=UPI000C9D2CA1|nr:probable glycosyltransferase STELLO2 isoform X1 [Cucurbita pepo subsp. pepo]XP_023547885.1 probable glycosyltransferase STELLO2 isoform X1 [Cucurbita pepo subsp. pepo]